jgi:hypothetical protein
MADFSSDELKQALKDALKESGRRIDIEDDLEKFKNAVERNKNTMGGLFGAMVKGQRVFKDMTQEMEELDEQLEKLKDQTGEVVDEQRDELIEKKKLVKSLHEQTLQQKLLIDSISGTTKALGNLAGSVGSIAVKTLGGFASGLQSGASAFSLAGGLMEGAMDAANAGAQTVAGGMGAVGSTMMMSTNPRLKALGLVATVAGVAIGGLANAATSLGKMYVNFMVKQLEMTVESFQKMSTVGALFTDGMDGMYRAATNAGFTIAQLSNIMAKNAPTFAESGLSLAGAVQMVGRVGAVMKNTGITTNLLRLGYAYEEHGALIADVMANLRRANSDILKDPAGIAKAVDQYATNLRVIASLTGEDARKKVEEARQQSANVAFRAKLMELDKKAPGTYQNTLLAMSTMSDVMRQSVMEQILFGGVINQAGAVIAATSQGFAGGVRSSADAIVSGSIATEKGLKAAQSDQGKFNDMFREEMYKFTSIGIAGMTGAMTEINAAISKQINVTDAISEKGVAAAQEAAKKQREANGELSEAVITAAKMAQQFAVDLQNKVLPELSRFALYSVAIMGALDDAIKEFYKSIGKEVDEGPSFWERFKELAVGYGTTMGLTGMAMAAPGGVTAPVGGLIGLGVGVTGAAVQAGYETLFKSKSTRSTSPIPEVPNGIQPVIPQGLYANGREGAGKIDPNLQKKLDALAGNPLFKGAMISSLNDSATFGPHRDTAHGQGRAVDIKIPGYNAKNGKENNDADTLKRSAEIVAALRSLGFSKAEDEYIYPSKNATGGHFHAELKDGAVVRANPGGTTVNVGEGGQDELVVPLKNGRIPGMDELIKKVEELIRVSRDHKDVSENIFIANQ